MMSSRIGFVGLGLMGSAMAARLQAAGQALAVYSRTHEHMLPFVDRGAIACTSPSEVASRSEMVFSMISTSEVLREISLGERGVLSGLAEGGIHIDFSTVAPAASAQLEHQYAEHSRIFLSCPVLGGVSQAREGTLLLFAGGQTEAFQRSEPLLKNLGSRIWTFPAAEQACSLKLLCNSFISGLMCILAQALVLARASNVPGDLLLEVIAQSALNSSMIQSKGAAVLARNFGARFYVEHMLKDIRLVLEEARSLGCPLPVHESVKLLYEKALALGLAKEDYSAIVKVLEKEANLSPR